MQLGHGWFTVTVQLLAVLPVVLVATIGHTALHPVVSVYVGAVSFYFSHVALLGGSGDCCLRAHLASLLAHQRLHASCTATSSVGPCRCVSYGPSHVPA
jgi:hypothetical protein